MPRLLAVLLVSGLLVSAAPAQTRSSSVTGARVACTDGEAAGYPCSQVDLLSFLPIQALGGAAGVSLNDIWGWTDPETGREYALVGRTDGTAIVDVTDALNPVFLGELPLHTGAVPSTWRDIKVYGNYMLVVADNAGSHGLQVFDLTQVRTATNLPVTFEETAHYDEFGSAHNVVVNEETGFAYVVGSRDPVSTPSGTVVCPGLHMVDVRTPLNPSYAGCFQDASLGGMAAAGYVHDAQCVVYKGPDADYQGQEVCFLASKRWLGIADVSDKANPATISKASYPNVGYAHQGWLTEDHRYFLLDDELDEYQGLVSRTRTLIWDVSDLDEPILLTEYLGTTPAIDHNLYVVGPYAFQANYKSGLRILDISDINNPREVAFFDTYPADNGLGYRGAWSVYPFFESGVVVVSSIDEGLFVLDPVGTVLVSTEEESVPTGFELSAAYPNPFNPATTFTMTLAQPQPVTVAVYDVLGRQVALLHEGVLPAGTHRLSFEAANLPSGTYLIRATGTAGRRTRLVTLAK